MAAEFESLEKIKFGKLLAKAAVLCAAVDMQNCRIPQPLVYKIYNLFYIM